MHYFSSVASVRAHLELPAVYNDGSTSRQAVRMRVAGGRRRPAVVGRDDDDDRSMRQQGSCRRVEGFDHL
jgi:hypothetical protein